VTGTNDNLNTDPHPDGGPPDSAPPDGGPADGQVDANPWIDAGGAVYGYVKVHHQASMGRVGGGQILLSAHFYEEQYDPEQPQDYDELPGFVETRDTPNGVTCHIFYTSGMQPPDPEPPPAPPEIDAGKITVVRDGIPFTEDVLETLFVGEAYEPDRRSMHNPDSGYPEWWLEEAMTLVFNGEGSTLAAPFIYETEMVAVPEITAPAGQDPVPQDLNGNFHLQWAETGADETRVNLSFNLDWDNSAFLCLPPAGVTELVIPADWITEYTWGSGEMAVIGRNEEPATTGPPTTLLRLRTTRAARKYIHFEINY
jgi:hypothetical protein